MFRTSWPKISAFQPSRPNFGMYWRSRPKIAMSQPSRPKIDMFQPSRQKTAMFRPSGPKFGMSLRGQTVHFVHCKRIPEHAKIRFNAESTTLLLFFDLLCCFGFHKQIAKTLYCLKSLQKQAILRNFAEQAIFRPSRPKFGMFRPCSTEKMRSTVLNQSKIFFDRARPIEKKCARPFSTLLRYVSTVLDRKNVLYHARPNQEMFQTCSTEKIVLDHAYSNLNVVIYAFKVT